jgi:sulfide:quinone oxidoreductase
LCAPVASEAGGKAWVRVPSLPLFTAPFASELKIVCQSFGDAVEIRTIGPMAAPVPITKEVSQSILDALKERDIECVPNQHIVEIDTQNREAQLEGGGSIPYDLFVGIPIHRVPQVVESSGLAVNG